MRVHILGVGMGPQHVTREAADALRASDYVLAARKAEDDGLLELRRRIAQTYGDMPVVPVDDPPRDRGPGLDRAGYERAVSDWHQARAAAYESVLAARGGTAAFLVWGDPSLYDSTIRIVETVQARGRIDVDWDVLPGISAPQLLAARHRIVLHEVGRPVHVTTGRRLAESVAAGHDNIVAMLNPSADLAGLDGWTVWWGANLGSPGEQLVVGRVADVRERIAAARRRAERADGWLMDVFLVRRPR